MHIRRKVILVACLSFMAAACGWSPTAESQGPREADDGATYDAVLTELQGLSGEERRARLIELADQEDGTVSIYSSLPRDLASEAWEAFEDETGISVTHYRASSETIRNRLQEEARAGRPGADVVETGGRDLDALNEEGVLAPHEPPGVERLIDGAVGDGWVGTRLSIRTVAWNTDLVPPGEVPQTYQDLADPRWDGRLAMEIDDVDWFKEVFDYLVEEQGLSESETEELFAEMARGAAFTKGHSATRELLSAGQYAVYSSDLSYGTRLAAEDGAPVDWQPPVEPLFATFNGAGLVRGAERPASAMLLFEWLLSDGQQALLEAGADVTRADLAQDIERWDVRFMDTDEFFAQEEEWTDRYERLATLGEKVE